MINVNDFIYTHTPRAVNVEELYLVFITPVPGSIMGGTVFGADHITRIYNEYILYMNSIVKFIFIVIYTNIRRKKNIVFGLNTLT